MQVFASHPGPPSGGPVQPAQNVEQCAFAAPAGAHQAQHFPAPYGQIQTLQCHCLKPGLPVELDELHTLDRELGPCHAVSPIFTASNNRMCLKRTTSVVTAARNNRPKSM